MTFKRRVAFVSLLFVSALGLTLSSTISFAGAVMPPPAPACDETLSIVRDGVDWLMSGQKESGLYAYEVLPREATDPDTQNMTRQAGALWGMIRSLEVEDRAAVRDSIIRARRAIASTVKTNPSPEGEVAYIEEKGIAKLNAAALYLLTLSEAKKKGFTLDEAEEKYLPMLASGLRQMREESGGFRYLYFMPEEENRITIYGSAEAVLALAAYAESSGDEKTGAFARDSFDRYYKSFLADAKDFNNTNMRGYFSWALHAQMMLHDDLEAAYAGPIRHMVSKAMEYRDNNPVCAKAGCIMGPGLSESTYLEGITAALPIMRRFEKDKGLIEKTEQYAALALRQIASLQVKEGDDILSTSPRKPVDLIGGFCDTEKCLLMRNDLAQHALIPLIAYYGQECKS